MFLYLFVQHSLKLREYYANFSNHFWVYFVFLCELKIINPKVSIPNFWTNTCQWKINIKTKVCIPNLSFTKWDYPKEVLVESRIKIFKLG